MAAVSGVVVVAAVMAASLGGGGSLWAFEVLAAIGLLAGVGVAFGAFDRGPTRRTLRRLRRRPERCPQLHAGVLARLRALDQVEHRWLELGMPWPIVLVGPTGVVVVTVEERAAAPVVARLEEIVVVAMSVVRSLELDRRIDVRGVVVVPDGADERLMSARVRSVGISALEAAIAEGSMVPMSVATALFARLSGAFAPDLRTEPA